MTIDTEESIELLTRLLTCHSTSGDEDDVASLLLSVWGERGLETGVLGRYAVWGRHNRHTGKPVLLVCAHMDSPGYAVDRFGDGWVGVTPLGGARFEGESVPVRLKRREGETRCMLWRVADGLGEGRDDFRLSEGIDAAHGDRVCFDIPPAVEGNVVDSPFIDNRAGCWITCEVASFISGRDTSYDVVVAATASEEMGGFGADVLAAHVNADAVLVVDATYESEDQGVLLGGGPVLTLSDHSVLMGLSIRDQWLTLFRETGLPLQTEVYNYSGTDARAFPRQGSDAPVAALLIPSRGNHSPHEIVDMRDLTYAVRAVKMLSEHWPRADFSI